MCLLKQGRSANPPTRDKDNFMLFFERLEQAVARNESLLCVGLDPDPKRLPPWTLADPDPVFAFNRHIIDLTCDLVCAYKPNIAFYEALGKEGLETLRLTIEYIQQCGVPVILDAKRNDIGSSAEKYACAAFEHLHADAITVNPYMGWDSVEPFLRYADHAVFVLALSSNPGAQDFQCLDGNGHRLYERVVEQAVGWNERGNLGLVVGATHADDINCVRAIAPTEWLLMPGVGSQGGDLATALANGLRQDGSGVIVNVSRAVMYADDPREAAMTLRARIEEGRALRRSRSEDSQNSDRAIGDDPNLVTLAVGLHDIGAVQFGEFTLHSGLQSPFYLDLRLLVSSPEVLSQAARAIATKLDDLYYDRLAAIPYAGVPIGTAVALQTKMPLVYPRKERKAYGTGRAVEGTFKEGESVVVLDDLITTGASKLEAIQPLRDEGLQVRDVAVLIDREGGGREELATEGLTLHSVFRLRELMTILHDQGRITKEQRESVERFIADSNTAVAESLSS
jgi:uridine monophosphate synthetase